MCWVNLSRILSFHIKLTKHIIANREIDVELKKMRYEHEYLKEKNKQVLTGSYDKTY